ncbi:MAG TPA: cell division protein FtsQ/DivIB [Stellaceae bacterium]|nr:cell division protein FtsQ/DivIB [Stellaceae bacterium]
MRRISAAAPQRRRRRGWLAGHRWAWRIGIPVLVVAAICGTAALSRFPVGRVVLADVSAKLVNATATLGFRVADIRVVGRETTDRETILAALGARPGMPLLAVDPVRAKEQLEHLPWVRSATIERRFPDTVFVRLVEREPMALWQHGGRIDLIDRTGAVIPVDRLDRFAKLPLVVGEDAARHAAGLLAMLASEPDLAPRVTAAVWVGQRRWNLRLDNAIEVMLPGDDPAAAWADLARLERSSAILQRDVQVIDMRLPDRLVVRLAPQPAKDAPPAKKGRPTAKNT